mmetsp:Transcript_3434/g.3910  ORF Transcript_3434/g.3910 Transcript_3434/m.3910 type:complete len:476 (-) Transcript_3434:367-1794(-)|eukprot:CAMPEP_0184023326 /NCGR_PEP_ID=MMETSP0954-20121128/11299_1 /TAXON_ID=627963 /ORGANISM="Aplanochytrium sp, Strain PBS07" /LENGTH=475 /DNA_ID=CAMNT_0026306199 /DNA_START=242 /DNA_END=1669 /DNA_ORIENTATION=+
MGTMELNDNQDISFDFGSFEFGYKSSSDEAGIKLEPNGNREKSNGSKQSESEENEKEETLEWLQRKRELVAKASKTAREKRRKEVELLRKENKRLKSERAQFLNKIEELNASVQQMRESGGIDLHIENELIKAQLEEHKRFVGGLMKMASGMPSTENSRKRLYKQGADYAANHVLSLLVRSVKERPLWKRASITKETLDSLGTGGKFGVWYRYVDDIEDARKPERRKRRLNIRLDHILPNVEGEDIASLYWELWNHKGRVMEFAKRSQHATDFKVEQLMHDNVEPSEDPLERDKTDESIVTSYVREKYAGDGSRNEYDWVFVGTKRNQELSKAALYLPVTIEEEKLGEGQEIDGLETERVKCNVLARSTTTHHEIPMASSENGGKPVHRINSLYVEGMVAWDIDGNNKRSDHKRCRMIAVLSIPESFRIGWLGGPQDIITPQGKLTEKFEGFMKSFVKMVPVRQAKSKKRARRKK